ncbi:hydrolase 1, exosortase A system-associated [Betaproteobacteria bacterium]|nr:hydrolase 1, exosortase A system-associated [Betaproteobacteria bacterium]
MNYTELPLPFSLEDEALLGVAAIPETPRDCGVLVVVGGPQYRAGSHRQFLLLSRRLAGEGYPVLRFDCRGMGDSGGTMRSFEDLSGDIGAAIDAFQRQCPQLRRYVLWGLCDAASAILIYLHATGDVRIDGIVLLNPWVRSDEGLAQTHIKHYYGQRLMQREFWSKLFSGKLNVASSLLGLLKTARKARQKTDDPNRVNRANHALSFRDRMTEGLKLFRGEVLLILSERDYTAREFIEYSSIHPAWSGLLKDGKVCKVEMPDADHTFSSAAWRAGVEDETLHWLTRV